MTTHNNVRIKEIIPGIVVALLLGLDTTRISQSTPTANSRLDFYDLWQWVWLDFVAYYRLFIHLLSRHQYPRVDNNPSFNESSL